MVFSQPHPIGCRQKITTLYATRIGATSRCILWPIVAQIGSIAAILALFATAALAQRPTIISWSTIARPGDIIALQGDSFGGSPTVWCTTDGGKPVKLTSLNGGNGVVQVELPSPLGLYGLYVKNGSSASNTVHPNQANPMHFDTPEVAAGHAFRIFGRNLYLGSGTPQVTFIEAGARYPASVNPSNRTYDTLSVTAPSSIPLGVATVYVTNGYGSSSVSAAACQETMIVRASGPDTFHIGVPWAEGLTFGHNVYNVRTDPRLSLHAAGNGSSDDQPALQGAIDMASAAGGGVVYLPAGTYALMGASGPQLTMASNVVVQGAGRDSTTLTYGFGRPGSNFWVAYFSSVTQSGLCDLSVVNENQGGQWVGLNALNSIGSPRLPGTDCSRIFLARMNGKFGTVNRIQFIGTDRVAIEDCNFRMHDSLLFMMGSTNLTIRNNTLIQLGGVNIDATSTDYGVIEHNNIVLDANFGAANNVEIRHGIPIAFSNNLAILNNTFSAINGATGYNNDTEEIISEGGGPNRPAVEIGAVSSANGTSTTLNQSNDYTAGTAIAIINGTGLGQWRWITARNGDTITIDAPWAVAPNSGSEYEISIMTSNTTIDGNSFGGYQRGIWIYESTTSDLEIANNTFHPGVDGVFLQPDQSESHNEFNPIWNVQVWNNKVTGGTTFGSFINLTQDYVSGPVLLGVMTLNNEIRDNSLTPDDAGFFGGVPPWEESYIDYLRVEAASYTDNGVPGSLGAVFQGNTANDCENQAFFINTGAYQTIIANTKTDNDAAFVNDSTQEDATHTSVSTVYRGTTGNLPAAPVGVKATPANAEVVLSWNPVDRVTSYNVYRGSSSGGEGSVPIANVTVPGCADTTAANGTTYYYRVTAANWNGPSGSSNEASATPRSNLTAPSALPAAVTRLAVNAICNTAILIWNPVFAAPSVQQYDVYRGTTPDGEGSSPYEVLPATQTTFADQSTSPYTTYYYKVLAVNSLGNGAPSSEASVMVYDQPQSPPAAPTLLSARAGDRAVTLSWNASDGASSYVLYRSTTQGMEGWTPLGGTDPGRGYPTVSGITGRSYTDTGLTGGTTYYYEVAAQDAVGASWILSPEASATPR